MVNDCVIDYTENKLSIEDLCKKYSLGKVKIKKILIDNNITIKKKGGIIKNIPVDVLYKTENKRLQCITCGDIINDVDNKSGIIFKHILLHSPNKKIPSSHIRRQILKTTGLPWFLKYFNQIDTEKKEFLNCPKCSWSSTDLSNKTGSFTKHINKSHGSIDMFLNEFGEYKKYFKNKEKEGFLPIENNSVICKICNKKFKNINQKHLDKHGINISDYKIKYLNDNYISETTKNKLRESYNIGLKHYEQQFKFKAEIEIYELITGLGFDVILNNKSVIRCEMDIYIPELKIGIEYNGLYYHTENFGKDKWYHLNKQKLAEDNGIKLIHIFEDEWVNNKNICINKIKHLLNKNDNEKIFARNTIIKEISQVEANIFLDLNHIQGGANNSTYNLGSYFNSKLIGVMSFTKNPHNWILTRFATDNNFRCVGIPSKLFKSFLGVYSDAVVVSYADRRWTLNKYDNLYIKLGFKLDFELKPEYRYFNSKFGRYKRFHKFNFRKKILLKKYPEILNDSMTENEMTRILGFSKIWDCGMFRFKYN